MGTGVGEGLSRFPPDCKYVAPCSLTDENGRKKGEMKGEEK